MQRLRNLHAKLPALFIATAGSVLASMVLAIAMAGSADLHERLHHDAGHEEHECAVTHLMAGDFVDATPSALIEVRVVPLGIRVAGNSTGQRACPLYLTDGVLEHAPPARV